MTKDSAPPGYGTLELNSVENGPPGKTDESNSTSSDENMAEETRTCCQKFLRLVKKNLLVILLILSLFVGIGMGAGLRSLDPPLTKREIMYLKFPGELLMNMLQLVILPLIVSSLISGLTSLDARASGRFCLKCLRVSFMQKCRKLAEWQKQTKYTLYSVSVWGTFVLAFNRELQNFRRNIETGNILRFCVKYLPASFMQNCRTLVKRQKQTTYTHTQIGGSVWNILILAVAKPRNIDRQIEYQKQTIYKCFQVCSVWIILTLAKAELLIMDRHTERQMKTLFIFIQIVKEPFR